MLPIQLDRAELEKIPNLDGFAKLIQTYPRRLKAVIAAKGASTKY